MPRPNFFIAGAPKCGTTALSEYLRAHPNVFLSTPKEPHFFATDLPRYREVITENDYLRLFDGATEQQYMVGEASVYYLYSETALGNIRQFAPDARIIAMVRNPVDLVHSLHSQLLYSRNEEEPDFNTAWKLKDERKRGLKIPRHCRDSKILHYDEVARLGDQLGRLLDIFPDEQVKIIFYDDFVKNTELIYRDVLGFLGLPDDNRNAFPKINQNKSHQLGWLGNITQRPPKNLVTITMKIKNILGIENLGVIRALRKVNSQEHSRQSLALDIKLEIIEEYHNDIINLSQLTGRNLDHWLSPQ